jgi:hypothetical protein
MENNPIKYPQNEDEKKNMQNPYCPEKFPKQ